MEHKICLVGYRAVPDAPLVLGTNGSYGAEILRINTDDNLWPGLTVKVTFTSPAGDPVDVMPAGGVAEVPAEAMAVRGFGQVAFLGLSADLDVKVKTEPLHYEVRKAGIVDGGNPGEVTPTLVEQILAGEQARRDNEVERVTNENARRDNEVERIANENFRIAAESQRKEGFEEAIYYARSETDVAVARAEAATENANDAADVARQLANTNGFVQLYIDDDGILQQKRTSNLADTLNFTLDDDGILEVTTYGN